MSPMNDEEGFDSMRLTPESERFQTLIDDSTRFDLP